jgi:N-acetylglucosaminyl-diphospho-decaprenol L-rhamnosyltransferase
VNGSYHLRPSSGDGGGPRSPSIGVGLIVIEHNDPDGARKVLLQATGTAESVVVSTGEHRFEPDSTGAVRVIHLRHNPGFGAAVNTGMTELPDLLTYSLICNTDITLPPGLVDSLRDQAIANGFAQIAPQLVDPAGKVDWDGGHVDFMKIQIVHESKGQPWSPRRHAGQTVFVTGACFLLRRDAWEAVQGMREDLFLYAEDCDFSLRLENVGLRSGVAAGPAVVHIGSGGVGRLSPLQVYLMTRNGIRLFREWSPHLWGRVACWAIVPVRLIWRTLRSRAGLFRLQWIVFGVWDARRSSRYFDGHGRFRHLSGLK